MDAQIESEAAAARSSREDGRVKNQAFELKGMMTSLTALRLRTADTGAIAKQLVAKVAQMPQFFQNAAVLVDLGALGKDAHQVHFGELAALLRSCKMVPVAVANADGDARARAAAAGFGVVSPPVRMRERSAEAPTPEPAEERAAAPQEKQAAPAEEKRRATDPVPGPGAKTSAAARPTARPSVVIHQPVRSGQRIYAEGADLLILAPVNSGAEVIADGHVHVYSTLRGRAVAGANGMPDARIFCQRLHAELVAISGAYLLADDLPPESKGKAVQIYLEEGVCWVSAL